MSSISGNTLHIHEIKKGKRDSVPRSYNDWADVKSAQKIIKTQQATKKQWHDLSNKLYKSIVQSYVEGNDYLKTASRVVVDWNSEVSEVSSLAISRSLTIMSEVETWQGDLARLKEWQMKLAERIIVKEETIKIYIYKNFGMYYFWVCVDDPSTQTIHEFSKEYINILDRYGNIECDFMVFGRDEIYEDDIPIDGNTVILNVKE